MHRKFKITVDGHPYEVMVEEIVGDGGAAAGGTVSWPASVAAASAAVAAAPAHATPHVAAGAGDEIAPLAGTVQSIDVTVGQIVKSGDKIAAIEAMKMKTEVHAKGGGKVVSIAVHVGESVDTGAVLLTLA